MKTIKKFWGVVFILALLSTLLIGAIPQASADSYAWANSMSTPGSSGTDTTVAPAGGFGILDVAQSGSTIWAVASDNATAFYLYRSTNAGATWERVTPTTPPAAGFYSLIAVAPDDPSIIAVVDTLPNLGDIVYYSNDSGNIFTALTTNGADLNDIDIAPPLPNVGRYIVAGGHNGVVAAGSGTDYLAAWPVGGAITAWNVPAGFANIAADDVEAVAFSPTFQGDQTLIVLTETVGVNTAIDPLAGTNGAIGLHCYGYNQQDWDQNIDAYFPKYLIRTTANQLVMGRAQMSLDPNFYMSDPSLQLLFIGANITANVSGTANTQVGGVFRTGTYSIVGGNYSLTQCMTGTPINSVAWDGTNLMAAQQGYFPTGAPVWRCNNPLATSGWSFMLSSSLKTPGTGNATLVLFNGGNGFAFSSNNSTPNTDQSGTMIGKSTDYGAGFNGIALGPFNSFGTMDDFFVMPDGSRTYAVTSDNRDLMVWRLDGRTWQRVALLAGKGAETWLVRADKDNKDIVWIARKGAGTMYKSADGGSSWSPRTCLYNIQDFAVQDAGTVYVIITGSTTFTKSINGGTTFLTPATVVFPSGGGNCFSINLLSDNNMLIGGTAGGFAYSTDGGTTFASPGGLKPPGDGNVLATATGLATGDWIFAVSDAGAPHANNGVYAWKIGTTNMGSFNAGQLTRGCTGIALSNGVLYVLENNPTNNTVRRFLNPTKPQIPGGGVAAANDNFANAGTYDQTIMINALQAAAEGTTNTLWARAWVVGTIFPARNSADTLDSLTDYLTTAADAPVTTYPANVIIPINSISGAVAAFPFQWNAPPSLAASQASVPGLGYNYNLGVYLDQAGTVFIAGGMAAGVLGAASAQSLCAVSSGGMAGGAAATQFTGAAGTAAPGTTYYWRVRVFGGAPALSQWSAMQTFVVEQLVAIVPIIASPANGGEVNTVNPGFSWSPIANATSYRFELSTTDNFSNIVYTADPATAGASVPSTITLTRGMQYFWHVKTLTPLEGEWSTTANFIVAELPPTSPTPTITTVPQPTITAIITQPQATTTQVVINQETNEVNPSYIWAIIIVGAVLVIAVIVLIVRTRRSV